MLAAGSTRKVGKLVEDVNAGLELTHLRAGLGLTHLLVLVFAGLLGRSRYGQTTEQARPFLLLQSVAFAADVEDVAVMQ